MTIRHRSRSRPVDITEDRLLLFALVLELQLDLLLVDLRVDPDRSPPTTESTSEGGVEWDGEVLDLTHADLELARMEQGSGARRGDWIEVRFASLAEVIEEAIASPEVRRHPAVVARLVDAWATCTEHRAELPSPRAVPAAVETTSEVEPGHFLG